MSFTIQRILGIAPVMVLGLLLLTPAPGLAQTVPPKADLVVTSLTAPPATALPGDSFGVTAGVRNQGTAAAGVSITKFELVSTLPGAARKGLEGTQNVSALAVGGSETSAVTVAIDEDTVPGTYFLQACANGTGIKIPESSTLNNCLKSTGTIRILDVPNLAVTAISNPPTSVPQGQTFAAPATYTVTNMGVVSAAESLVKFYLAATVGTTRVDMKTTPPEAVGALGPGATFTHAVTLTVKPETAPGTYRLQACADSGKTVAEKNENDNCKTSVGTVQVTPAPDLVVNQVTVTGAPLSVAQKGSLAVQLFVRNLGAQDAVASTLRFRLVSTGPTPLQKGLKGIATVPAVPVGTRVAISATPSVDEETVPGTYVVQACADYGSANQEISESNNCGLAPVTVTVTGLPLSLADLAVTALTPPPASKFPGETFALTATLRNNGTEASTSTTTKFNLVKTTGTLRKNLKGVQIVGPLAAGATNATAITVEVYEDTVPGSYVLEACADGEKQLTEKNEGDNCLLSTAAINVLQVPNLVITQVGNPPATAVPGKTSFLLTETVQNIGPVGAPASIVGFTLVSTVDPLIRFDLRGAQDVPALASTAIFNGSGTVTVRSETLPGSYRVQACADYKKAVLESDEDGNCALSTGAVQVSGLPDLIVTDVTLPPAPVTVAPGGPVTLTTFVKNQGLADAGSSFLRYSLVKTLGAAPIKNIPELVSVPALAPGVPRPTTMTVAIHPKMPLGVYFVLACVDQGDIVVEYSDENNCRTSVATIEVK